MPRKTRPGTIEKFLKKNGSDLQCQVGFRGETSSEHQKPTLPETNIAPKNGWLEYEFPCGKTHFQVRTVSFREGNPKK